MTNAMSNVGNKLSQTALEQLQNASESELLRQSRFALLEPDIDEDALGTSLQTIGEGMVAFVNKLDQQGAHASRAMVAMAAANWRFKFLDEKYQLCRDYTDLQVAFERLNVCLFLYTAWLGNNPNPGKHDKFAKGSANGSYVIRFDQDMFNTCALNFTHHLAYITKKVLRSDRVYEAKVFASSMLPLLRQCFEAYCLVLHIVAPQYLTTEKVSTEKKSAMEFVRDWYLLDMTLKEVADTALGVTFDDSTRSDFYQTPPVEWG